MLEQVYLVLGTNLMLLVGEKALSFIDFIDIICSLPIRSVLHTHGHLLNSILYSGSTLSVFGVYSLLPKDKVLRQYLISLQLVSRTVWW